MQMWDENRAELAELRALLSFISFPFLPSLCHVQSGCLLYPSWQQEWEHHTSSLPTPRNDFIVVFLSVHKNQGGKDICKACSQNPFPCKFTGRVLSICLPRMSDNKLLFHLLCWKTQQQREPGVPSQPCLILPAAQTPQPCHAPLHPPFLGQFTLPLNYTLISIKLDFPLFNEDNFPLHLNLFILDILG